MNAFEMFWMQSPFNPFQDTGLFLYTLKTLEKLWFSDVFWGTERN